jgi:hypothetical protein
VEFVKRISDLILHPISHSRTLGLLMIFILVSVVFMNVVVLQQHQTIKQRAAEPMPPSPEIISPTPIPTADNLCASFTANAGETNCMDAAKIALEKYPGDIKSIKSETVPLSEGSPPNITRTNKSVWTLEINLKEPEIMNSVGFNSVKLFIVKENGKLRINTFRSGKL